MRDYAVLVSDDGAEWREAKRGLLGSTFGQQTIRFDRGVSARFVNIDEGVNADDKKMPAR